MTEQNLRDGAAKLASAASAMKQAKRRVIQAEDELVKAKNNAVNATRGYEIAEEEFAELLKDDDE